MIKAVFFGTPDFALPILEALFEAEDFTVVGVVTQPDSPVGRKQIMTSPPVKLAAENVGIPAFQFASLKKLEVVDELKKLEADVFVVFSYGKIIPESVLSIPRLGCINVHPSKLPTYRGPTPVPAAIVNGDAMTAVSIMVLDKGMDTGPILAQADVVIEPNDTAQTLMHRLIAEVGAPLVIDTIRAYDTGKIKPVPQNDANASICKLLDRESGFVTADTSPELVGRMIRAYSPWPGVYTIIKHNGKDLRVKLLLDQMVQPEGGKPMTHSDFERGYGRIF